MEGTRKLRDGLSRIPGLIIVGKPCMNLISYTTQDKRPDIFVVADQLEDKGWMVERQQFPDCIHLSVLPTNVAVIDQYLADLKEAYAYAKAHPGAVAKGNAALYGLMARVPFRGMVEKSVRKIMEDLYGSGAATMGTGSERESSLIKNPFWTGLANRLLTNWSRWKRALQKRKHLLQYLLIVACLSCFGAALWSQPYVDPFQLRYLSAFNNKQAEATPFTHLYAGCDLPIKLGVFP